MVSGTRIRGIHVPADGGSVLIGECLHPTSSDALDMVSATTNELARLIQSPDTRVLIYCNNNFAAAPTAFPEKVARAALNHHAFATLVAYGYRNVFELAPLVDVASTEIPLEGDDAP
jgi:hypothetical protein